MIHQPKRYLLIYFKHQGRQITYLCDHRKFLMIYRCSQTMRSFIDEPPNTRRTRWKRSLQQTSVFPTDKLIFDRHSQQLCHMAKHQKRRFSSTWWNTESYTSSWLLTQNWCSSTLLTAWRQTKSKFDTIHNHPQRLNGFDCTPWRSTQRCPRGRPPRQLQRPGSPSSYPVDAAPSIISETNANAPSSIVTTDQSS